MMKVKIKIYIKNSYTKYHRGDKVDDEDKD